MYTFKVGEAFPLPEIKTEGATFSVEPFTMMLIYRFDRPTEEEIEEFRKGDCELALTEKQGVLFLLSHFGRLSWSDTAYSTHLYDTEKKLPDLVEGSRGYSVDAFLVDCHDNTLKAHRLVRMTPEFSVSFREALEEDKQRVFDEAAYDRTVAEVFARCSTAELLRDHRLYMKEIKG